MLRKIIRIDEEKCNGCGLCVNACHEGALQLVNGKARLVAESYCDGLGACLPECPTGALVLEEREAAPFDEEAVQKQMQARMVPAPAPVPEKLPCGCPGTHARVIERKTAASRPAAPQNGPAAAGSQLRQWPCQIKLVPANAPYFHNAHLLVAADCTAYAYAGIHNDFMRNKVTIIGCPKLDNVDYAEKLTEILRLNEIKSVTVLRMEVPCCGGMVNAVKLALQKSGQMIPWRVVTISTSGEVLEE